MAPDRKTECECLVHMIRLDQRESLGRAVHALNSLGRHLRSNIQLIRFLVSCLRWFLQDSLAIALYQGPVGKTLPTNALECLVCTLRIVNTQLLAFAIAEIKLGQVTMQMLLPTMLIRAFHSAFEDREETLDCIRMDIAVGQTDIFVLGVIDGIVLSECQRQRGIPARLISHDMRFAGDVLAQDWHQIFCGDGRDHRTLSASPGTVDKGETLALVMAARMAWLRLTAAPDVD